MGSKACVFVCPRFFYHSVILTGQSNLSIYIGGGGGAGELVVFQLFSGWLFFW